MNIEPSKLIFGGEGKNSPAPTTIKQSLDLSGVNLVRIVFIILLLLSLFTFAKSFIAMDNVEEWSDDVRRMFMTEQVARGKHNYPNGMYIEKFNAIQKQWIVMRYVGIAMAGLSCYGIFLAGRREQKKPIEEANANRTTLNRRLIFGLVCTLSVPLLEFVLRTNFGVIVVSCIALVVLLPVLIRGSHQQRFFAALLLLSAGSFAHKSWVTISQLWLR